MRNIYTATITSIEGQRYETSQEGRSLREFLNDLGDVLESSHVDLVKHIAIEVTPSRISSRGRLKLRPLGRHSPQYLNEMIRRTLGDDFLPLRKRAERQEFVEGVVGTREDFTGIERWSRVALMDRFIELAQHRLDAMLKNAKVYESAACSFMFTRTQLDGISGRAMQFIDDYMSSAGIHKEAYGIEIIDGSEVSQERMEALWKTHPLMVLFLVEDDHTPADDFGSWSSADVEPPLQVRNTKPSVREAWMLANNPMMQDLVSSIVENPVNQPTEKASPIEGVTAGPEQEHFFMQFDEETSPDALKAHYTLYLNQALIKARGQYKIDKSPIKITLVLPAWVKDKLSLEWCEATAVKLIANRRMGRLVEFLNMDGKIIHLKKKAKGVFICVNTAGN